MKIFISGATGFIGGHLSENLIKEGHEIKTIVRESSKVSFIKALGVEMTYGDISDYSSVKTAMKGCEMVYHMATVSSRTNLEYEYYYAVNVKGTDNIMQASLENGVSHVVYCSTTRVYGRLRKIPAEENSPLNPNCFYATTKLEGEKLVSKYCNKYRISGNIARLPPTYGTRNLRWLKLFQEIVNNRLIMIGSGKNYFQITYVDDVIQGLKLCGKKRNSLGECYNIGCEEVPTIAQFINTIAEESDVRLKPAKLPAVPFIVLDAVWQALNKTLSFEPSIMGTIEFFTRERMFDISKAKKDLNFSPKVSLREGVRRMLAWYRENSYL